MVLLLVVFFFFFKQKTAYELRISDWSSDVCSSDLVCAAKAGADRKTISSALRRRMAERVMSPLLVAAAAAWPAVAARFRDGRDRDRWIGRASCRERVCQYV